MKLELIRWLNNKLGVLCGGEKLGLYVDSYENITDANVLLLISKYGSRSACGEKNW